MEYLPDYFLIPSILLQDDSLEHLDYLVYSVIYWYTKLKLEKCIASNKQLAEILRSKEGSIANSITRLKKKYINSIYQRETHVRELIPLISFEKSTSSKNEVVGGHFIKKGGGTSSTDESTLPQNSLTEIEDINKNNNTNVLEKKSLGEKKVYGKPEVDELINLLKGFYPNFSYQKMNRNVANTLINKHGKELTVKMMTEAYKYREEEFCPQITDYIQLQRKWDRFELFLAKQQRKSLPTSYSFPIYRGKENT